MKIYEILVGDMKNKQIIQIAGDVYAVLYHFLTMPEWHHFDMARRWSAHSLLSVTCYYKC